ncbi:MAG: hypothetical protein RMN25_00280 [Anaerolineae bacterium]|nr:hypothetical protein [Thermoflexales bacterium]MDW8406196.1 hypothetical protein [Anaerolineae bacterium]
MNPFTRSLLTRINDPALIELVRHWDELEALMVRVYRQGLASAEDEATFTRLRVWLKQAHPVWQHRLAPYWPRTRIGGMPTREDPLVRLLAIERAADVVGNWAALQTLPAARETLNLMLLDAA